MANKRISQLTNTITAFRTDDVIAVDGPSGTAKMSKDNLLKETAENAESYIIGKDFKQIIPNHPFDLSYVGEGHDKTLNKVIEIQAGMTIGISVDGNFTGDFLVGYFDENWVRHNGVLSFTKDSNTHYYTFTEKCVQLVYYISNVPVSENLSVHTIVTSPVSAKDVDNLIKGKLDKDNGNAVESDITSSNYVLMKFASGETKRLPSNILAKNSVLSTISQRRLKSGFEYNNYSVSTTGTGGDKSLQIYNIVAEKGNILEVSVDGNFVGSLLVGYYDENWVRHNGIVSFSQDGKVHKYIFTEKAVQLLFYFEKINEDEDVLVHANIASPVNADTINGLVKSVNELKLNRNLSFSILGDSYSTYYGWIPPSNPTWYAVGGVDGTNARENDVSSVTDTWWYKLSKDSGMSLIVSESFSGSSICNMNYGHYEPNNSFVGRMINLNENNAIKPKPNLIIVFGGTNDKWSETEIGTPVYSDWTADDLKQVAPATCYVFAMLQKWNPQAKILNMVNTDLGSDYEDMFEEITTHYGVANLVLSSFSKSSSHPNKSGMQSIFEQVKTKILEMYDV